MTRPIRADIDAFASYVHRSNAVLSASGASHFAGPWWLNAPHNDLRKVDGGAPGRWNLFTNPAEDGDTSLSFSAFGTGSGASLIGNLRMGMIPSSHMPSSMLSLQGAYFWLSDCADNRSVIATAATGTAERWLVTPYLNGELVVRINSGTSVVFPCPMRTGLLYVQRLPNGTLQAWLAGQYLGVATQAVGTYGGNGIGFFRQLGNTTQTRRQLALAAMVNGNLTDAQVQELTVLADALVAYGRARQIATSWHPLVDHWFYMMQELGVTPNSDWQAYYNTLVQAYDTAGILSHLDLGVVLHGHAKEVAMTNFVWPRSLHTVVGGVATLTHTAKVGTRPTTAAIVTPIGMNHGNNGVGLKAQLGNHFLHAQVKVNGASGPPIVATQEFMICPRNTTGDDIVTRSGSTSADRPSSPNPKGGALSGVHGVSFDRRATDRYWSYVDSAVEYEIMRNVVAFSANSPIWLGGGSGSIGTIDTTNDLQVVLAGSSIGDAGMAAIQAVRVATEPLLPT